MRLVCCLLCVVVLVAATPTELGSIGLDSQVIALEGMVRVKALQDILLQSKPVLRAKNKLVAELFHDTKLEDTDCATSAPTSPTVHRLSEELLGVTAKQVKFTCSKPSAADVELDLSFSCNAESFGDFSGKVDAVRVIAGSSSAMSPALLNTAMNLTNIHIDTAMLSTSAASLLTSGLTEFAEKLHLPASSLVAVMGTSYRKKDELYGTSTTSTNARYMRSLFENYPPTEEGMRQWESSSEQFCTTWCAVHTTAAQTVKSLEDKCQVTDTTPIAEKINLKKRCVCSDDQSIDFGLNCPSSSGQAAVMSLGCAVLSWMVAKM